MQKLEEIATKKPGKIIRDLRSKKKGQSGYDEAEMVAAKELLNK